MNTIFKEIDYSKNIIIERRRHIHTNPEVGFETKKTEQYVLELLKNSGIEVIPSTVGVMGLIRNKDAKNILALRADMDALNLEEENDVEYKSRIPGKMHACGHDGHTAMLMSAAEILNKYKKKLKYNVLLLFQPAEEGPNLGGARIMLNDLEMNGLLQNIKYIFGQHITTEYDIGKVSVKYGSVMSSTDEFTLDIIGKGGHAGMPHETIDAISIAAKIINEMESFMSRRINPFDPAVFSIGTVHGGSAKNIIAERVQISGTIRCQSESNRKHILENAERIIKGLCLSWGADYSFNILHGLPVLSNDEKVLNITREIAKDIVGNSNVIVAEMASMGAEDFAYFSKKIPSAFIFLGARNINKGYVNLLHNPKFDFDEEALPIGVKMLCAFALQG